MVAWEWAAAGAVFLGVVVFCVRLMKRGLTTLEDERAQCLERIRVMDAQIREDQKNMPSSEHLRIARAGLEDLLRLAGNPPGTGLEVVASGQGEAQGEALVLHLPGADWRVSLNMRERALRGVRKVAHGRGRWHLRGPAFDEEYVDLARLMLALSSRLAGSLCGVRTTLHPLKDAADEVPPQRPHFERRFVRRRRVCPAERKSARQSVAPSGSDSGGSSGRQPFRPALGPAGERRR